jgi:hypothetical protein
MLRKQIFKKLLVLDGGLFWTRLCTVGFHRWRGISWPLEQLSSQGDRGSMDGQTLRPLGYPCRWQAVLPNPAGMLMCSSAVWDVPWVSGHIERIASGARLCVSHAAGSQDLEAVSECTFCFICTDHLEACENESLCILESRWFELDRFLACSLQVIRCDRTVNDSRCLFRAGMLVGFVKVVFN